jgi:hypothetical protein
MADRYWVRNGAASSAFSTASYWNTAVDGSGSAGVPTTGDDIHIGSPDTLAVGIGNATCVWDSAITVGDFITHSGYTGATVTSDLISFQAPDIIIHANSNWADLGFREGMTITTTGATSSQNNDTYIIQSIVDNQMTVASGVSNVADEAAGATVTMTCTISLRIEADTSMDKFTLDCTMENTTGGNVTITFSSSYPASSGERYVLNGDNAVINNKDDITYAYNTSSNGTTKMHFDDGPHPKVTVTGASYISPEYKAPTSTLHGETSIHSLSLGASVVFQPDASPTASSTLNASKVFSILTTSTLAIGGSVFDAGFSTFSFTMNATNWTIPVTGDTTYGTAPFKARFYNLIIATPSTAGFKALVPNDRTLSVNSLTVEADAVLKGHATAGDGTTSTICSVSRPRIQGSWNFSQLSDGVYVSLMSDTFPITPSSGPVGRVQFSNDGGTFNSDSKLTWTSATSTLLVDGKLTVTGLIDPTGMEFTAVASNPSTANPAKTIWVNSGDSNKLYFGSSAVGGGGGGSGTVTSVATTAPITGGTITGTGTIGISAATTSAAGSMSGADKTKLDGIETSADVTDATNVTAAGALMDSEVTNLAQVKAFDSADYATAAQGTTADAALPRAGGTMTGEIEATTITLNAVPADPATDDKVRIGESGGTSNMFQIRTNDGYLQLGPNNSGYAHIQTDRARFYFNQPIIVDGGGYFLAYNDGLKLGTGTSAAGATVAIEAANGSPDITVTGTTTSTGFIKTGGSSSEFLMADGSVSAGSGGGAKQTCMVRLANDIASFTPTGAYVLVNAAGNWTSTNVDFDENTGLYTAPTTGVYRISWTISFRFTSSGQTQNSRIYVNGNYAAQGAGNSTGNWPVFGGSILLNLQQGDEVGLYVYISNTGKTLVGDSLAMGATQMSINEVG